MFSTIPRTGSRTCSNMIYSFAGVFQRDVGRRRHNHRAGQRRGLDQRQLHIAGTGRQVDHQIVEFAPVHVAQELLDHTS